MAEIAVQTAIQLLAPLINAEVSLILGLADDVRVISDELYSISTILKSAEERAVGNEETKVWVKRVRNLAYEIEDVVEEYELYQTDSSVGKLIKHLSLGVRTMATTIKSIREKVVQVGRAREWYRPLSYRIDQPSTMTSTTITMRMNVPEAQSGEEVVGVEIPKRDLIQLLMNPCNATLTVALVGMRGIGKTTLVDVICNDPTIRTWFPMRAMICVSPSPRRSRIGILRSMMKQFCEADKEKNYTLWIKSLDQTALQHQVRKYLKEKRYLVVLDDAQEGDREMMSYVKQVLPTDNKNSKILVTTRYENVARAWLDRSCDCPYRLNPLPADKAWLLFCKFQRQEGWSEGICPPYLEGLARRIVRKCDGLPPAIVAIRRLLSTKPNDYYEWKKVHDSLRFYLQQNNHLTGIYEILIRSYYDVPCLLKPCFLYFGVFPKGYAVDRMRLIRLWIAEGFIRKDDSVVGLTLEDIAEDNLKTLINMSLVEVACKDSSDKRPKTLRVNEFLHEIILSKLDELSFCQILSGNYYTVVEKPRRLAIHVFDGTSDSLNSITKTKCNIRGLFAFGLTYDILATVGARTLFKNVHLLKVLDLRDALITDDIPSSLGKLRNLRYLSLRSTPVERLPSSIGKLQYLQTLDLKQTRIRQLPTEINELHMLRHLLIYSYEVDFEYSSHIQKVRGVRIPKEVSLGNFRELQKLAFLDLGNGTYKVRDLKELRNLRKLGIIGLKSEDGKDLCAAIQQMHCLQAFNVYSKHMMNNENIDLEHFEVHPPPQTLRRLYLNGPLRNFPRWISELHNLIKIRLRWSALNNSEPFNSLAALPNLVELQLLEAYNDKSTYIEITNGGFKKLKILHLLDLHKLVNFVINKTALPVLEELSIGESPQLQMPSGIKYLRNLKTLNLFNMPLHFTDLIRPHQQYHDNVKHVPNIILKFKCEQGFWI